MLLVAVVAIGVALAAPSTKNFTAGIAQTGQTTYLFTLTNELSSNQTLGSANVGVPDGFDVLSAPPLTVRTWRANGTPAGKAWTSRLTAGVIELRAGTSKNALAPGEFLTLEVPATASCSGSPYAVGIHVKQSNSFSGTGNDFVGPSQLPLDVIGPAAEFAFAKIGLQVIDVPFGVTVTAMDECENVAIYYDGTPTLSGLVARSNGTAPTYPDLSFEDGVASGDVTPVKSQLGAQLTASDGEISEEASNEFDVVARLCTPSDSSCTASDPQGTTHLSAPVPPEGATIALAFADGGQFTCGTERTAIGSFVIIVPEEYPEEHTEPLEITGEWPVGPGDGNPGLCLSKDDGVSFFAVEKCARTAPEAPCELSRKKTSGSLSVTFLIDPDDPWGSLG